MLGRYVTDILKMCMKKFKAEFFWTNLQGFDMHIAGGGGGGGGGGYTVSLAFSQLGMAKCFSCISFYVLNIYIMPLHCCLFLLVL